jgi:hypothetical protein
LLRERFCIIAFGLEKTHGEAMVEVESSDNSIN